MNFIQSRPRLVGALSLTALGGAIAYLEHRRLTRSSRRISITALPKSSACRRLLEETGEQTSQLPWGTDKSTLLSPWSGGAKTHWISSFVALQVDVPVSLLLGYGVSRDTGDTEKSDTTYNMTQNLVAAFLDARSTGPESWVLDKCEPPLSPTPGSLLFGRQSGPEAFFLGTWGSQGSKPVEPLDLPSSVPSPCTEFPFCGEVTQDSSTNTAGAVLYWNFPKSLVRAVDSAASNGMPWRLMEGGFQEFIVERTSHDTARLTYVTIECTDLHPGGQSSRNFKTVPKLLYEGHVLYAQSLFYKTIKQLEKPSPLVN